MDPSRQLGFLWGATALSSVALAPLAPRLAVALPVCPFHALTGLPCPGCGATRAALALVRGDVAGALLLNPLAAAAMIVFVGGGVFALAFAWAGHGVPEPKRFPALVRLFAVLAVAANWVYLVGAGR